MKIKATNVFRWISKTKARFNFIYGGAGSSKSWSMAQWFIVKSFHEERKLFMVFRKTFPSMRLTAMKMVMDLVNVYNLDYEFSKTTHKLITPTDSEIIFTSLDDPLKFKSASVNYIWAEEATELDMNCFRQLDLRLRWPNDQPNQMFLTFNPIGMTNWIHINFVEKSFPDAVFHHSTCYDNPFLDRTYVGRLEHLIEEDKNFADIYLYGKWGVLEDRIYNNYDIVDGLPSEPDEVIYGEDYGFNNPNGIVMVAIKDKEYYLRELLYKNKMTNQDLINAMESLNIPKEADIYGDSAEPARIEEIYQSGYVRMRPAVKGPNSVKDGIDFCKRHRLHITKDSPNLIKEIGGYQYKRDKDDRVLDEPVPFNNHLLDAFRYAIYTHEVDRGGTTEFFIE